MRVFQLSIDLQGCIAELLKNLLRKEHNQQVMCDAGFPHELLSHGNSALADESHPVHPPLQYMFERLSSQSLTPRDLRFVYWFKNDQVLLMDNC